MMNFEQFQHQYLDKRTALGDVKSLTEAAAMAHAYALLSSPADQNHLLAVWYHKDLTRRALGRSAAAPISAA